MRGRACAGALGEKERAGLTASLNDDAPDWVRGDYPDWLQGEFETAFGADAAAQGAGWRRGRRSTCGSTR